MSNVDHTHTCNSSQDLNDRKFSAIGHYGISPVVILEAKMSSNGKVLFGKMASLCSVARPQVWVCQPDFARRLGVSLSTLYRTFKELLRLGVIKATGLWKFGRYKIYEVIWTAKPEQNLLQPALEASDRGDRSPMTETFGHPRLNINRVSNQSNKQTTEKPEAELPEVAQGMLKVGLSKKVVVDLIESKGAAQCQKQVEHLQAQQEAGTKIKNAAAWLCSAVRHSFAVSESGAESPQESQKLAGIKKNNAVFEEAKKQFELKNYQETISGTESLLGQGRHFPAADLLARARKALERASVSGNARPALSAQAEKTIWDEAWTETHGRNPAKQTLKDMKASKFWHQMAEDIFKEKVMAL